MVVQGGGAQGPLRGTLKESGYILIVANLKTHSLKPKTAILYLNILK